MSETVTHDALRDRYRPLVGGETVPGHGEPYTSRNPATEEPLVDVEMGDESDIDHAVADAVAASEDWWRQEPQNRGRVLTDLAGAVREHSDRLARLVTLENGKPLSQAESEVEGCARYFEYYAGLADKVQGESIPLGPDHVDFTVREPLGVTAHIVPWNYPLDLFARSVAPALATGNAAVVKPAEYTPATALEVGTLALEAGVPPGVLNVVPGYGSGAGAALAGHPDVDGVSFTGSVATGREVAKQAVDNINPVHLELGGKSPSASSRTRTSRTPSETPSPEFSSPRRDRSVSRRPGSCSTRTSTRRHSTTWSRRPRRCRSARGWRTRMSARWSRSPSSRR